MIRNFGPKPTGKRWGAILTTSTTTPTTTTTSSTNQWAKMVMNYNDNRHHSQHPPRSCPVRTGWIKCKAAFKLTCQKYLWDASRATMERTGASCRGRGNRAIASLIFKFNPCADGATAPVPVAGCRTIPSLSPTGKSHWPTPMPRAILFGKTKHTTLTMPSFMPKRIGAPPSRPNGIGRSATVFRAIRSSRSRPVVVCGAFLWEEKNPWVWCACITIMSFTKPRRGPEKCSGM
mmetsp:Transcript_7922/g.22063  ORF Transcript_7922/g.22063 Transcript_7922/m.22063 type:complete len:233 (+) Transcript_7922:141-839(+)